MFNTDKLDKLVQRIKRQNVNPNSANVFDSGERVEISARNVTLQWSNNLYVISYTMDNGDAMYIFSESSKMQSAVNAFVDCFKLNMANTGR